jgi:hypothetical protein
MPGFGGQVGVFAGLSTDLAVLVDKLDGVELGVADIVLITNNI